MSNEVFPDLPGLSIEMKCNSEFSTIIHTSFSSKEARSANAAYPMWLFSVNFPHLDDQQFTDLETLHGFICQRRGRFDTFLYAHRNANAVVGRQFGTGNGTRTDFQLTRSFGGFVEPVENPNLIEAISLDDVDVDSGDYSVSSTGSVSFNTAPASGVVIRWTGSYYFRCRFDADATDFTEFASKLFNHESLQFKGSPVNKL